MIEKDFICWYEGQKEIDGIAIKASNVSEAARMAVDIWRHANAEELEGRSLKVFVREQNNKVSEVVVDSPSSPQASM